MREKIVCLCTCTSIEIMTVVGVTSYLIYLNETILALISSVVFAKLIIFHFVMDYYDKKSEKKKMNGMNHSLIKKKTTKDMKNHTGLIYTKSSQIQRKEENMLN